MAVIWLASLPAPEREGFTVKPVSAATARETQSGRKEVRRWGADKGDTITCTLRLLGDHPTHGDQVAAFRSWWDRDLNFGANWIEAEWLDALGYTSHCVRIVGYVPRRTSSTHYSDLSLTLAVRGISATWEDSSWPTEGTGGGETPVVADGPVVVWRSSGTGPGTNYADQWINLLPSGLRGIKAFVGNTVVPSGGSAGYCYGVCLGADGAVTVWGYDTTSLAGGSSLGGIADIAISTTGFYYLTASGYIGHIGTPTAGTGYPTSGGFVKIWSGVSVGVAQDSAGLLHFWASSAAYIPSAALYSPRHVGISPEYATLLITDYNGNVYRAGTSPGLLLSGQNALLAYPGWLYTTYYIYLSNGTWVQSSADSYRPAGLVPTDANIVDTYCAMATHTDGTVHVWALNGNAILIGQPPSGLKALHFSQTRTRLYMSSGTNYYCRMYMAIQKED